MQLTALAHQSATLLTVFGRIDQGSSADFLSALQQHLPQCTASAPPLILDFSGVDYISSVGLRALMIAARQTKATQGKIAIISMQPLVREVFGIARFDLVIPCFNDLACAIEGLAP